MMEPMLQITGLVKRYPTGTEALRGVDLDVAEGEFYGLLGPNGAGKSTLIHCTTGLAKATSGSIRIAGREATGNDSRAREAVGLAPQDLNIDFFLTVRETLDYHGGYFGMDRRDRRERTAELLDRALMHRPKLLILDEPTAGVDVELRLELWQYVQRINAEGTTILLTTHYLEEAEQLCDRISFLTDGQIVVTGTPGDLARTYEVTSLEDAYLQLVGRGELSRARLGDEVAP
jgi:ABC-2 type transport system ATP-binding protein